MSLPVQSLVLLSLSPVSRMHRALGPLRSVIGPTSFLCWTCALLLSQCVTSTETIRLVRDGQRITLRASLSGTFLQALPDLVTWYATEGAFFISAQLSTDAVSALRKVGY